MTNLCYCLTLILIGGMILQSVVNGFGVLFIAGFTATNKLYGILEVAAISFGYAITTFVSQNHGAKQFHRLKKGVFEGNLLSLATSILIGAIMIIFGNDILMLFISGTNEEVEFASHIPVESTVKVVGTVRKRDEETLNTKIATGDLLLK